MTKAEFENRIGGCVSQEEYVVIEHVYTWHPAIPNVGGKDKIAEIYRIGGMEVIADMDKRAIAIENAENAYREKRRDLIKQIDDLGLEMARLKEEWNRLYSKRSLLREQLRKIQIEKYDKK